MGSVTLSIGMYTYHYVICAGPVEVQCDVVAATEREAKRVLFSFLEEESLLGVNRWEPGPRALEEPSLLPVFNVVIYWRGNLPKLLVEDDGESPPCECKDCRERGKSFGHVVDVRKGISAARQRRALVGAVGMASNAEMIRTCRRFGSRPRGRGGRDRE